MRITGLFDVKIRKMVVITEDLPFTCNSTFVMCLIAVAWGVPG